MFKKVLSAFLCAAVVFCSAVCFSSCGEEEKAAQARFNLTENISDGEILQCFSWDFNTIYESLDDIAAAGFSAIQTSPVNACLEGEGGGMRLYSDDGSGKWYYHYQPTDFKIGNYQLGTRDEFKKMCEKADELGIKVLVDIIANHTTPVKDAVSKDLIDAVGGIDKLYHKNSDKDITNWGDRLQCTTYNMGGLPDINTENKDFQDYFIKFVNDCIDCGADGFRYDTAKHIGLPDDPTESEGVENNFWERVTTEITDADRIFNYGEVLQGDNDRLSEYIDKIGATTVSSYGGTVRSGVSRGMISQFALEDLGVSEDAKCVTWVESHDNYINDGNWSMMDDTQVTLGWAIITARQKGTPLFFARPYGATTENEWGTMNRIGASGDMFYKSPTVRAVNFFRNAMVGEDESFMNPDDDATSIVIGRGNKGAVIVNTMEDLPVNFDTNLADGEYTDRVDGKTVYTVKDGKITCDTDIPANTVVVLYNEGYQEYETPALVKISDDNTCLTAEDEEVELIAENTDNATYSINGGKETSYKNGDKVTMKASDRKDGVATLTLRATNSAGDATYMKYYFTDPPSTEINQINSGDKITFTKPDGWDDTVYAYIYDGEGGEEKTWPGNKMKSLGGGKYEYTVKSGWFDSYVIFSDGTNQYPAQGQQGVGLKTDGDYSVG